MPLERDDAELDESTLRWAAWGAGLLLLFAAAFPIYRLTEPTRRESANRDRQQQLATVGEQIYVSSCSSCHGPNGTGGIGPALGAEEFLTATTAEQIADIVAVGIPGSQMAAYSVEFGGSLTDPQVDAVVAYVRALEANALSNPDWRFPLSAKGLTGRDLYQRACASCHGANLEGVIGPELGRGSEAADDSDNRIFATVTNGKDEMPRFSGSLSEEQIRQIIEYLRQEQASGP